MIDQSEEGFVVRRREKEGEEVWRRRRRKKRRNECSGDSEDCNLRAKLNKYQCG